MATNAFKQDLPPKGGYAPINFKRIPARTLISGKGLIFVGLAHAIGATYFFRNVSIPKNNAQLVELEGMRMAVMPLMLAERDRHYIRACRNNRDAELELMADVPEWECGTWYGQKVFKTVPDSDLLHYYSLGRPSPEYGAHFEPRLWKYDKLMYTERL